MTSPARVAVGLGSNLGDRQRMMDRALDALDSIAGFELHATSSLYASAPWGDTDQNEFLNAVVVGASSLPPLELLAHLQRIEQRLGKVVVRRWGPRCIDLDLLAVESQAQSAPPLELPHPRIRQRPFVVNPLREALTLARWDDLKRDEWSMHLELDEEGLRLQEQTRLATEFANPLWGMRGLSSTDSTLLPMEADTRSLGRAMGAHVLPGTLIGLRGPLGAGKSVLARGLAEGLGHRGPMPSPTYTLCRRYEDGRLPLEHWDFYRLDEGGELESSGFDARTIRDGVCAVEWVDRAPEIRRDFARWLIATLAIDSPDARRVTWHFGQGCWSIRAALARWGDSKP